MYFGGNVLTIDNCFDNPPQRQKKQCIPLKPQNNALNLFATCIAPNPNTCPRFKTSSLKATHFYKNTRNTVNDGIQWNFSKISDESAYVCIVMLTYLESVETTNAFNDAQRKSCTTYFGQIYFLPFYLLIDCCILSVDSLFWHKINMPPTRPLMHQEGFSVKSGSTAEH